MARQTKRTRGASLRRVLTVQRLLREEAWTVAALARRLKVTPRTIFRDLGLLEDVGVIVTATEDYRQRYHYRIEAPPVSDKR